MRFRVCLFVSLFGRCLYTFTYLLESSYMQYDCICFIAYYIFWFIINNNVINQVPAAAAAAGGVCNGFPCVCPEGNSL